MDKDSPQTLTSTEKRLHVAAITVEHKTGPVNTLRYARLGTILVVGVGRKGTLIHCAEVPGHPYTRWKLKTQPKSRDFTPYFMSKEELPQMTCNSLKIVQVSRLGANERSEHIQPAWIAQSQNSKKHQVDVKIDTGAGCNVMPLYKVQELFGQE